MDEAPYRRIAGELRERIARGELPPGSRVPSTRAITRDWGVAMATATKVLAVLRDEGLVETRPGAGTVVAARRGRGREADLSRDRIVRAALGLADAEGLGELSMRRVAAELGVATMSLYRHVRGKDELTLLMTDAVLTAEPLPERLPAQWRARLETVARRMWTVLKRHPWAAEVLSTTRPQLLPGLLRYAECSLAVLRSLGLGADEMMHLHLALFGHVRSTALSLREVASAEQDTGMTPDELADELDPVAAFAPFPALAFVARQGFDYDLDAIFESGLRTVLDGISVRLREAGRSGGARRGHE